MGMNRVVILGKLVVTTCNQASGAPLVDKAFAQDVYSRKYKGWAILLTPWKRNRYGESLLQKALVVGWRCRRDAFSCR